MRLKIHFFFRNVTNVSAGLDSLYEFLYLARAHFICFLFTLCDIYERIYSQSCCCRRRRLVLKQDRGYHRLVRANLPDNLPEKN